MSEPCFNSVHTSWGKPAIHHEASLIRIGERRREEWKLKYLKNVEAVAHWPVPSPFPIV
jgi:hypothetical protein